MTTFRIQRRRRPQFDVVAVKPSTTSRMVVTRYLKHKGEILARAYPWDSDRNLELQRKKHSEATGVELAWEAGPATQHMNP